MFWKIVSDNEYIIQEPLKEDLSKLADEVIDIFVNNNEFFQDEYSIVNFFYNDFSTNYQRHKTIFGERYPLFFKYLPYFYHKFVVGKSQIPQNGVEAVMVCVIFGHHTGKLMEARRGNKTNDIVFHSKESVEALNLVLPILAKEEMVRLVRENDACIRIVNICRMEIDPKSIFRMRDVFLLIVQREQQLLEQFSRFVEDTKVCLEQIKARIVTATENYCLGKYDEAQTVINQQYRMLIEIHRRWQELVKLNDENNTSEHWFNKLTVEWNTCIEESNKTFCNLSFHELTNYSKAILRSIDMLLMALRLDSKVKESGQ